MKKLLFGLLAAIAITACSTDETTTFAKKTEVTPELARPTQPTIEMEEGSHEYNEVWENTGRLPRVRIYLVCSYGGRELGGACYMVNGQFTSVTYSHTLAGTTYPHVVYHQTWQNGVCNCSH